MFVPTTGSYVVSISLEKSSLTQRTSALSASIDGDAVASAVWDTPMVGHTGSNTFGEKMAKKILTVSKFLGLK